MSSCPECGYVVGAFGQWQPGKPCPCCHKIFLASAEEHRSKVGIKCPCGKWLLHNCPTCSRESQSAKSREINGAVLYPVEPK